MSFVISAGYRIHYEVLGTGAALVLQHGLAQSAARWELDGYVDALERHYQLILIDARGHGESDKPYEPAAYRPAELAGDVVAVLDAVGVSQTRYWGYSLGAIIGFSLADLAPERVAAFVLGGNHPFERQLPPQSRMDGCDPDEFARVFLDRLGIDPVSLPARHRELLMANDFRAIAAAQQDRPSLAAALTNMTMPCLMYAGDRDAIHDRAREAASQITHGKFVSLSGLNHGTSFRESGRVLADVLPFLAACARAQ